MKLVAWLSDSVIFFTSVLCGICDNRGDCESLSTSCVPSAVLGSVWAHANLLRWALKVASVGTSTALVHPRLLPFFFFFMLGTEHRHAKHMLYH